MLQLITDLMAGERIANDQLGRALDVALRRYSKDRPRTQVADVTAIAGTTLPFPVAWEAGVSQLIGLESPVDLLPVSMLGNDTYALVNTPGGEVIRLAASLAAGAVVRVHFTGLHTVDTVPLIDEDAVAHWAAAFLAEQTAAKYSNNSAPTIQADSIDNTNPAKEWAKRATMYRQHYAEALGISGFGITGSGGDSPITKAAGTVVEFDLVSSRGRRFSRPQR